MNDRMISKLKLAITTQKLRTVQPEPIFFYTLLLQQKLFISTILHIHIWYFQHGKHITTRIDFFHPKTP